MAIVLQPFSVDAFNALPPLEEAGPRFDKLDAKRIIVEELQLVFQKHGVAEVFGLQLLHQHFQLSKGEYLTEINGTSTPVHIELYNQPCSTTSVWGMSTENGRYVFQPLEFVLDSGKKEIDRKSPYSAENIIDFLGTFQDFLRDLHLILKTNNLEGLFGLVRHPGIGYPGRVEITNGRANINLTPEQGAIFVPGKTREAAWFFDENFTQHGCRCLCPDYGSGHNGHSSHVITQSG